MEVDETVRKYKRDERYTYADYAQWDDDKRWELIDGVAYAMAPGPSEPHQGVSIGLAMQLGGFLRGKQCKLRCAPFDVRLNADGADDTVVQPDIVVICDHSIINNAGVAGVPDLVIEILSPSSVRHDMHTKFQLYKKAGVKEYWVVDPGTKMVQTHILSSGEYITRVYSDADDVPVAVLEGCIIKMQDVFAEVVG